MDGDGAEEMVGDVPVLGTGEDILDYVCRQWVDEVFLCLPEDSTDLQKFQAEFENMGITVHTCLGMPGKSGNRELSMGKLGNYAVATSAIRVIPAKAVISKRLLDIAGGIVGCLITLIFVIIIGPMIYVKSSLRRPAWERTERSLRSTSSAACTWTRRSAKRRSWGSRNTRTA